METGNRARPSFSLCLSPVITNSGGDFTVIVYHTRRNLFSGHGPAELADSMDCSTNCNFTSVLRHGSTNFTCQQLTSYCEKYTNWTTCELIISDSVYYSQIFAGFGGLICYVLMYLTFRLPTFEGPSYLYHKSMVILELVHMAVMLQVRPIEDDTC